MGSKRIRNFIVGLSFLLLATSLTGLVLSGFSSTSTQIIVQDVSESAAVPILNIRAGVQWLHNTSTIDFRLSSMLSAIGTSMVSFESLANSVMPGSLILALGTISLERRDQERLEKLRDRVIDEISTYPGIHLRELHRSIGCAMGALQYHLNNLENDGVIISVRNGNARHLFLNGYSSEDHVLRLAAFTRNPTIKSILQECAANGRITQAELSRTLSVDKSLVSYYVSGLVNADILHTIRVFGREKPLVLSDWARNSIISLGLLVQ
ncbi:MAG: winged helix-turn-helix transcriptional regulator [Candidatus Thorarchaeota archaeon]|jgi:predicted transcriptional regulator